MAVYLVDWSVSLFCFSLLASRSRKLELVVDYQTARPHTNRLSDGVRDTHRKEREIKTESDTRLYTSPNGPGGDGAARPVDQGTTLNDVLPPESDDGLMDPCCCCGLTLEPELLLLCG